MSTTHLDAADGPRFTSSLTCGFGDFDFLLGTWKVHHHRLKRVLSHSNSWQDFVGRSEARKILGGFGILDENILFDPHGTYRAMSIRTFDVESNIWSIWWYDGRIPARPQPLLLGKFEGSVGVFLGNHLIDGSPVLARSVWTPHADAPRLERAFSMNNGLTWETNWTMEFRRTP